MDVDWLIVIQSQSLSIWNYLIVLMQRQSLILSVCLSIRYSVTMSSYFPASDFTMKHKRDEATSGRARHRHCTPHSLGNVDFVDDEQHCSPYSCRHFSECYTRLGQLKAHLLKSHNEGTWFTCDICQQQFTTRGELKKHSRRRCERVKLYVCVECPWRFCTATKLRLHHLVHSDMKRSQMHELCCNLQISIVNN